MPAMRVQQPEKCLSLLNKRAVSAADFKLLQRLRQTRSELQIASGAKFNRLARAPLFPKFVCECAATYHELRKRGTRARNPSSRREQEDDQPYGRETRLPWF